MTVASNLYLYRISYEQVIKYSLIKFILFSDIFLLTALLYFSGGPENPFSILYFLHVVISAILLDAILTWAIAILTSLLFAGLFIFHVPTAGMHQHHAADGGFNIHLFGMWAAYVVVSLITAYCLTRITSAQKNFAQEEERYKQQQLRLTTLTTLAAGAAHELSTPLSTIAIAVSELDYQLKKIGTNQKLTADIHLIEEELNRCKNILTGMGKSFSESAEDAAKEIEGNVFLGELKNYLVETFDYPFEYRDNISDEKIIINQNKIKQAIHALVKNAIEASVEHAPVTIDFIKSTDSLTIQIADRGRGIGENDLQRIGEPFYSTKEPEKGMGLGIFLTKLIVDSMRGKLVTESQLEVGTVVKIIIPLR